MLNFYYYVSLAWQQILLTFQMYLDSVKEENEEESDIRMPSSIRSSISHSSKLSSSNRSIVMSLLNSPKSLFKDECLICLNKMTNHELVSLNECRHSFCSFCFEGYLIYKIQTMEELRCPKEGCPHLIDREEILQYLPSELKGKYEKLQLWLQTIDNPNLKLCPSENCKGLVKRKDKYFHCDTCEKEYCSECMYLKHEGRCDANFQKNFKLWKKCPKCNIFIAKGQGCNHMTCTACKHQFCMVCLSKWSTIHQCIPYGNPLLVGVFNPESIFLDSPCGRKTKGVLMVLLAPLLPVVIIGFWLFMLAAFCVIMFFMTTCEAKRCLNIPYWLSIVAYPIIYIILLIHEFSKFRVTEFLQTNEELICKFFKTLKAYFLFDSSQQSEFEID